MSEESPEEAKFWTRILESCPGSQVLEEVRLLRYHLGITSEDCHISNFHAEDDLHEFSAGSLRRHHLSV